MVLTPEYTKTLNFKKKLKKPDECSLELFFEKIKDITGTTPANFILECRLNKATALLIKNPTLRMDDIAAYLGFSSGRYFCKCFKNHFGISPLQYRKQDQG